MTERDTIRAAICDRIRRGGTTGVDNVGLGVLAAILLGLVPLAAVIAICVTVYYSIKAT